MNLKPIPCLLLAAFLLGAGAVALAQDAPPPPPADAGAAEVRDAADGEAPAAPAVEELEWGDYTVKAYSLMVWGGGFGGATYLDNPPLGDRTVLTDGAGDIIGYNGEVLEESTPRWADYYDAARKEIKPGDAFGARIGVYIADHFHLDMNVSYASGDAVTSMIYTPDPVNEPDVSERIEIDKDTGFKVYRGGISMMYDAVPATFFGIEPRLGFGLGGVINRYSELEDKTALYLEASFGLSYDLFKDVSLDAQVDLMNFAYEVDELGYSNMVSYTTYAVGLSWFLDRVPEPVRAAHIAESRN